jgi:GT2 family glycosyltransferase
MSEEKTKFKYAIIIPTCAKKHIEFKFLRLLKNSEPETLFIYSVNPLDMDEAEVVFEKMDAIHAYAERYFGRRYHVERIWEDGPTSFGDACNKGYRHLVENYEPVENIVFLNDDVDVTFGWQRKLKATIDAKRYYTNTILVENKPGIDINKLPFRVGMAGPLSNMVGSSQIIQPARGLSTDQFANNVAERAIGPDGNVKNIIACFISGFCLSCHPDMLREIYDEDGFIFDPIFLVGGYEDNDLAVRALNRGWISLIDQSTYVGHDGSQTLDADFKDTRRGMVNISRYFEKWKDYTQARKKIVGAYRVGIFNVNNLAQMGSSLRVNHRFLDGMAILLTNNPAASLESYDKALFDRMNYHDQEFLSDCKNISDGKELAERFRKWIHMYVPEDFELRVECWSLDATMNEREERNYNYEMATAMDADWIISIDSDECFEDRMTPEDIRRLTNDPDPLTSLYTFGWLNHYESMSVIRTDFPFCKGFESGMNGVRMWKVWNRRHFPIVAGNDIGFHCGNAPEYGPYVLKGTCYRFRHMSMVREIDRASKASFYNSTDQDKDSMMIGASNYNHIARSEGVPITLYRRNNGIGFFNLAYDGEDMVFLAVKIKTYSPSADAYLVVWTSEWSEDDRGWTDMTVDEFPSESQWRTVYPTGPDRMIAVVGRMYGVRFIHHPFEDGLARCRNQALKYFMSNGFDAKIGWALYLDPDEWEEGRHHSDYAASFRRMAESTDTVAFKFQFKNVSTLKNGRPHSSLSESMRLIRLDRRAPVFFSGKVHETIEASLHLLSQQNINIVVNTCPLPFLNMGLNMPGEQIAAKLEKYQRLLVESIGEDPYSSAAWTSLGMTYEQDRDEKNAEICYERACLVAGTAFLPFQCLALLNARRAVGLLYAAMDRTRKVPELYSSLEAMFKTIREQVKEFPVLEDGDAKVSSKFELPPFPYDEIVYDEGRNQIVRRRKEGDNGGDKDPGVLEGASEGQ